MSFSNIQAVDLQVIAMQNQFGQSEEFHTAQVNRLQSEINAFKAEGKFKEAEARMAYLVYHQNEITKIKSISGLAGEKGSLMEQAVNALQVLANLSIDLLDTNH